MSQDRDGLSDQQRASIDDRFVEALLQEAYLSERDASSEEERVKRLMQALDGSEVLRPTDELAKPNHVRVRHRRWVSYVLAGCFLLFAFIWYQQRGPGNRAYAAIEKCLSISPKLREYRLTTHRIGSNGQAHATSMQLYFDDRDRFVLSHPSLLRLGTTWIGGDATHRWIVPPLGPVLVGGEEIVGHWLTRKSVNSPFLHIHSILSRVKRSYRLEWQGEVTIDNPFAEKCQHVKATLLVPRSQLLKRSIYGLTNLRVLLFDCDLLGSERLDPRMTHPSVPNGTSNTPESQRCRRIGSSIKDTSIANDASARSARKRSWRIGIQKHPRSRHSVQGTMHCNPIHRSRINCRTFRIEAGSGSDCPVNRKELWS